MEELTYNYYCINDNCTSNKMVHITKSVRNEGSSELCNYCGGELKCVGINTNIVHKGTQESINKMNR